jgi:xylan 1,4-beta-xylosidase
MSEESPQVHVHVDAAVWLGPLPHNWTYIGYDEINYTYTPEGKELLHKFGQIQEQPTYVRAHHLLCTGNCHGFYKWGSTNAYLEDEAGQPRYDWTFVDLIFDTLLQSGCKPFVELGFMPQHLADPARYDITADRNYRDYRAYGWACPPKDYGKWYDLIHVLVRHCLDRYGLAEVRTWYWELWNEPDLDYYWKGTLEEFTKLYDYTAAAVKAACPQARVGGPGTTNPAPGSKAADYLDRFLAHCAGGANAYTGGVGTPLDFVSFHVKGGGYQADPLHREQAPPSVDRILSHVRHGHEITSRYANYATLECVLSEIDPDGWAAGGAWDNANLNFRNTEYYPSFVASAFHSVSRYARQHHWDLKLLTWAFLFVGERCFEGTRTFSTQGIDKPILNLFRLYAKMGNRQLQFESSADRQALAAAAPSIADLSGFATLAGDRQVAILIYNHHDDWSVDTVHTIDLVVDNLPFATPAVDLVHYRIDGAHSNGYTEWVRQGRPLYPAPGQRVAISARTGLEMLEPPRTLPLLDGKVKLTFDLPTHGISLLIIEANSYRQVSLLNTDVSRERR